MHCLIIANDPATLLALQPVVNRQFSNCKLSIATSCEAALLMVRDCLDEPIDLVLIDLLPVDGSAIAAIEKVRQVLGSYPMGRLPMLCDIGLATGMKRYDIADAVLGASSNSLAPIVDVIGQAVQRFHPQETSDVQMSEQPFNREVRLTSRQKDIVQLVMAGYSNKKIANSLNLSYGTVKNYMFDLMRKFNVTSRLELAIRCQEQHQPAFRAEPGAFRLSHEASQIFHRPQPYAAHGYIEPKPVGLASGTGVVSELRYA